MFDGKIFKRYNRENKYKPKNKIKRIIYKYIKYRRNEFIKREINTKSFCNSTIIYIFPNQNKKSGYFLKKKHSLECEESYIKKSGKDNNILIKDNKDKFISECEIFMNSCDIYDRRLFKKKFKELYNNGSYDFPLNNTILNNIITRWRSKTTKFTKISVFENAYDYTNRLILREFRSIYIHIGNKKKLQLCEFIIWGNDENIARMRISKNYYIDATFHHPPFYKQLLIIMYKDILTNLKIPALYILMNGKKEEYYDLVFRDILDIITLRNKYLIIISTVVTDTEIGLIKIINKYFPTSKRIGCLYHYKQDLIRNLRSYGLYKKKDKEISNTILKILGALPFEYKGNISYLENKINDIINQYPKYKNFVNNYFKKHKFPYFIDKSLDYHNIPNDSYTNNYLENYNRYLKNQLGKHRVINWINFLNFLKLESDRIINKLLDNSNHDLLLNDNNNKLISNTINNNEDEEYIKDLNVKFTNIKINESTTSGLMNINDLNMKNYNNNDDRNIYDIYKTQIGILNIANSCFVNSIIQIIIHCKIFIIEFLNNFNINKLNDNLIITQLYNILISMYDAYANNLNYIDITKFLYIFGYKHNSYNGYIQHDALEFFRYLLEDISKELNENKHLLPYKEIIYSDDTSKYICKKEFDEQFFNREKSIITNLFYSQLISTYKCTCKHIFYSLQNVTDITLLLPENSDNCHISDLLNLYFKDEILTFEKTCVNCKKK